MKPLPHTYQARLLGGPTDYAVLSCLVTASLSAPVRVEPEITRE